MSGRDSWRRHVLHSAAGGVLVLGVWVFLVRPIERGVAERREALAGAQREVEQWEATLSQGGNAESAADEIRGRLEALYEWTAPNADPGRLYEALRSEARRAGVRIERIEPGPMRQIARGAGGEREPLGETFGYTIEVTGTYAGIASFVDACEERMGATKVSSLRVSAGAPTPEGREPVLSGVIETMHLRLTPASGESSAGSGATTTKKRKPGRKVQ
jgi:hypothetical protein